MNRNNNTGFTLIELMIVVAIVGILATIAMAAYDPAPTHRTLGQTDLSGLAEKMEAFKVENGTYVGATTALFSPNPDLRYTLSIQTPDEGGYTLRATPTGSQAADGKIELTSTGRKRWDRDNDGFEVTENCWKKSC
ncbi:MAG: prepilin-type N-terminal cleavage/methylation domain-containing protein [Pseudomonadales bacterium]|nr:prepilin-type N-terminal cleavage/methylation domain-containing protein [Pseudomonadales bacterium]